MASLTSFLFVLPPWVSQKLFFFFWSCSSRWLSLRLRKHIADFFLVTVRFMFTFFTFLCIKSDLLVHFLSFDKVAEVRKMQRHLYGWQIMFWLSAVGCGLTVIVIKSELVLMIQQNNNWKLDKICRQGELRPAVRKMRMKAGEILVL